MSLLALFNLCNNTVYAQCAPNPGDVGIITTQTINEDPGNPNPATEYFATTAEFCDADFGTVGSSEEGPDFQFDFQIPGEKTVVCSDATLTVCRRGDFRGNLGNPLDEAVFVLNGAGTLIGTIENGLSTGVDVPDCDPTQACTTINIAAQDISEDACDGVITIVLQTCGGNAGTEAAEVDNVCNIPFGPGDFDNDGQIEGNCVEITEFSWEYQSLPPPITANDQDLGCLTAPINSTIPVTDLFTDLMVDADGNPGDFTPAGNPEVTVTVNNGGTVNGNDVMFTAPGCYEVTWNIFENCAGLPISCYTPPTATAFVLIAEQPVPAFTYPTPACPNDVLTPTVTSPAYVGAVMQNWTVLSGPATIDEATGELTVTGCGPIQVQLEEIIPYEACGTIAAGDCRDMTTFDIAEDTELPVITCPDNVTGLDCNTTALPDVMATATDNCTAPDAITIEMMDDLTIADIDLCVGGVITRTYTATDECGNVSLPCTVTFTFVADEEAPVITCPEPADTPLLCGEVPTPGQATATDNCTMFETPIDGVPDLMPDEIDPCAGGVITYLFTAVDDCGLEAMCMQTFTYEPDTEEPVLSEMPADVDLVCGEPIPEVPTITATDNCTEPQEVVFEETTMGTCPEATVIMRTWTATDDCGNVTTYTQTINIPPDDTPPVLSDMPADLNLICTDAIPPADEVTATDDCIDPIEVVFEETEDMGVCPEPRIITRTWTATDACMNEATYTQTITIAPDVTPPVLSDMPADLNLTCADEIPPADPITATDDCTDPQEVVFEEVDDMGVCPDPRIITRTWTATDECMNETTYTQTITVAPDTTPPVLSEEPADITLVCGDPIPEVPAITATDDCTNPQEVVFEETTMGTCPEPTVILRTWTATDDCGNETTYTQTIDVPADDMPPVLSDMPADLDLICTDAIPPADPITATDDCTMPIEVVLEETDDMGVCPDPRIITRTWTATDACMNEATYTQTITIAPDTTPPVLSEEPADENLTCADAIPPAATVTATDDCTDPQEVVFEEVDDAAVCPDPRIITRTWTATDDCGNETTYTQTITIAPDATPPVITCPPDDPTVYTLETDIPAAAADIAAFEGLGGTAMDDCGMMTLASADEVTPCPGAANQGMIVRTYTITDECGNESTCDQTLLFSCCEAAAGALAPIDDICIGESITGVVDGTEAMLPDYAYDYVLTDAAGAIITGPNTNGMFTPAAPGDYCIYGVSYQTATGAPDYSSGDINTITQPADCFEITSQCFTVTDLPTVTVGACAAGPAPTQVLTGLEGTFPMDMTGILPDIYVFCEPGCVEAAGAGGAAPYMYEWFELSGECAYDFNSPIANTPDASGLGTGTYSVVVTDDNGCTATGEVKVFVDEPPTLTASADTTLCAGETFDLEGTSLPGPGICLEYCEGELPVCIIDDNTVFTVCFDFTYEWISDLNLILEAPNGTQLVLVSSAAYPNPDMDGNMCFTNDANAGNGVLPGGALDALDWNNYPGGTADAAGLGIGISGNWFPQGGQGAFGVFNGVDANSGTWQVIILDDLPGLEGFFNTFTLDIVNPDCELNVEVDINMPIIDFVPTTIMTEPIECEEIPNCTATYQWTGSDGFDSGVQTITPQTDLLETFPLTTITPPPGTTTYTLTVTDCFDCVSTEEVVITVGDEIMVEATSPICEELDITTLTGGTPDYTVTIGFNPDASDALATATITDATAMNEFTALAAGDYFISVVDANGCSVIIGPVTVEPCELECDLVIDIDACAAGPPPTQVFEDLEGTFPDGQLGILPDVYVFCEPGCLEAFPTGGTAPLTFEWFELSMECAYDFNAPIANTPDASGLGTGTYIAIVTDANGCTDSLEVKVFVDEAPTLNASADTTLCAVGPFDLEGTSLPGPGFCLEYCGGALPVCPIDADAIITVCLEFTHTYISDLSFELVAPDGTVIPLVMGQCCPNGDEDGTQFCFTNETDGGAVPLDWNTTGSANADLLGTGAGISGNWLPEGGAGVLSGLAGIDANGGPWAMIVTDIIGGDSGQFESFNVTITGTNCNTVFQSPVFGAPIPDTGESFTYETPIEECEEQPNCTASYQWTGDDGSDSGILTIANQSDQLETFPPFPVNPPVGTTTYTLTVTDCFGCVSTEEVVVTVGEITAIAVSENCGELDITDISGGTPDYMVTIGMMPDASDAIATATVTDASAMPEFMDLDGGDYYISIVDADGCSVVIGPIMVEPCDVNCDDFMVDVAPCANGPAPTEIFEDLEGVFPMDMLGILPDVYVFCEPGCVSGVAMGGTAPLMYEWFELSDECAYDFNSPIANTQDASGLGSGVYQVVITDANGCTGSQEVKVFVNTPPELTTNDDAEVCAGETFDLEGTSLPTSGFCLEYCEGELPVCLIDDNTIFTVCFDFEYTWISDLNLQLQAPDGTLLTLVSSQAYPNPDMDGNLCFTNDASVGGGVLPGGALDALNWNNYPGGTADAAGLGIGVSGNWFPEGGQGAFSIFNGIDANSGTWQVIILDDLVGFEGFFNTFTLDIVNPDCELSVEVDINMPIIDFVPTTIMTEPIECEEQENCTASYQWTGSDGFDSGVIPIANQQNMLETLPPVSITGTGMDVTYILTVTDCFGCVAMDTLMITCTDTTNCTALVPIMEIQDLCSGNPADLTAAEANVLAGVADPTQITGVVNFYTDAALTMAYTGAPINHSGATCDPEMTILFAEVVCNDGTTIPAGQIDITVYPFAEVVPPTDDSCVVMVSVPDCPNLTLNGPTNPTGGADVANWDPATGTYTGQDGDLSGTLDFMITGGTAPCDTGTITVDIPACNPDTTGCDNFMVDIGACTAGPAPTQVFEDLEGTFPDGQLGTLPDVYVFCEPGCVEAFPTGGTAPIMYEWFELSMECAYDFNSPIANTPDASGLGTGTYIVVVTDDNGCTASQEVKVFIDEDATLTLPDDAEICAGETFNLEGTALPGPGFCLEYCSGALAACPIDTDAIITVCMEFTHTFISDLSFELVAPDGTVIPLVMGQCCPNGADDATMFCFTNDTSGGAVALDWNTTGSVNTDLLGLGVGISGNWLPEGGAAVLGGLAGINANGGPWAMIVTDIIGGDSGQFESFNVTITGTNCNTVFQSPVFGAPIPDTGESFTYETPIEECVDQPNCIASYQWTGTDGFDSGVIPITPQTDMLNTLPPVPVTVGVSATYTLTVTDCYGCTTTSEVTVTECSVADQCTTLTPAMEVAEVCGGQAPDLSAAEAAILGSVADPTLITGAVLWFTDAAFMMPYTTGTAINHSGASCDPETVTLFAQVVCNDGVIIPAGQIDLTVYPFGPQVNPGTGCIVMLEVPACGGLTLGAASNATGGADVANWDPATMSYTGVLGDAAGTIDFQITGGTAPCDMGTVTIDIPACDDDGTADDCTALTQAMETLDICGGTVPDLATIETNILTSVVDPTLIVSAVNWYFDAAQTMPYTAGTGVNHSNTTCDPETVVLYGEVVCNDGASIYAGTVAITVLPFGPTVTPGEDCVVTLTPSTCANFMIGAASNPTGGVDLANWDPATNTYTGQIGDMAGTFDLEITGGTAPCDAGTVTISIPNCPDPTACDDFDADVMACAAGPVPSNVFEGLEGTFPGNNTGILPDIYVFCEPGCLSATPVNGLAPYTYEWFELSGACAYDFNSPIATTQDISGLGTGTYTVVITDANGCSATQEVKVFIDTPPVLTSGDDAVVCAGETFDLTGTSQSGPGFCLDYCGGEAPQCIIEANSIIEICLNFQHTFISDLSFDLVAPDGTMVNLITGVCCPIGTDTPNDQFSFCFTNDPNAAVLDWNNGVPPPAGSTWQPVGGAAALSGLIGSDANAGSWAMTITDIVGGDSGQFFDFNVTITTPGGGCNTTFQSMAFNAPIPDDGQAFTYETPLAECEEQMNCTASYQWTGTDGFDSGVIPIANPSDALETLPPVTITVGVTATYTLTVTDCFACVSTETITITECSDTGGTGFDLALAKTLSAGQASTVAPGDNVSFDITVTNQGTVDAFNVLVNDFVPAGYTFDPALNPAWADTDGDGNPDQVIASLTAGATQTITIVLTVNDPFVGSMADLVNYAEIGEADDDMDPNNTPPTDDDSTADNDPTNDAGGTPGGADDDFIGGDGTGTPNDGNDATDEDDQDPAFVDEVIDPNDCTTLDIAMESIESCGGAAVDLTAINAAILGSIGDPSLVTNAVNWYFDNTLTTPYTAGGPINHSDSDAAGTCNPGTVTLYGEVVCLDGESINAGTITVTIYPFAEVTPPGEGSCTTVVAASDCPNLMLGAVSNATGGVDLANWDAATGIYTAQLNDAAGTFDIEVTGGTAPCDSGTLTVSIPECTDDGNGGGDACTTTTEPMATAEVCGGLTPDLSSAEAGILAGIGDISLITGDVIWYTDAALTMQYDGGDIDHDDSTAAGTCDAGIVALYAEVICNDGERFAAGTVNITVYPFAPNIAPAGPGCMLVVTPACPGDVIGLASNAIGGASLGNWDPDTGVYTAFEGDFAGSIDLEITSANTPCGTMIYTLEIPMCGVPDEVPTVGEWGLIILGLLMSIVAVLGIRQGRKEEEYHIS